MNVYFFITLALGRPLGRACVCPITLLVVLASLAVLAVLGL